ncbi:hypothetical protein BRD10_00630, partial [Halobacteriales archaeon SW_12_71_31]
WPRRRALLLRYEVDYIYLGQDERAAYGTSANEFLSRPGFSVAVSEGDAVLVAVNRSRLRASVESDERLAPPEGNDVAPPQRVDHPSVAVPGDVPPRARPA